MCFSLDWSSTSVHYRHVFLRMFWQSSDMLLQKLSFDFTAYQGEGNKIQTITWHISLIAPACLCPLLSGTGLFFFLQIVFRPPLDLYDVLIHLNSNQIPRHLESVDRPVKSFSRGVVKNSAGARVLFPVVDYDPVQCYLQDLRVSIAP